MAKRGGTGVNEDNEDKAGEDGEDNYRAPYLARLMLRVEKQTLVVCTPRLLACGHR
jgi:hypothetical protein